MLEVALNEELLNLGIRQYCLWDYKKSPHCLIIGASGSGKTYFLKLLLGRIAKYVSEVELIVCDFKGDDDFSFLNDCENFYRFDKCLEGLNYAVQLLRNRQNNISSDRHPVFFVFDEWTSFINLLEKKSAEEAKKNLATLLMLGRSFQIYCLFALQRPDASNFGSARDNFSMICAMGKLSKETVEMIASDFKESINKVKERGHGTVLMGGELVNILVPTVSDANLLHRIIADAVHRP